MTLLIVLTMSSAAGAAQARSLDQPATPMASPAGSPAASPIASPAASPVATPPAPTAWVELGPDGAQIARAIADGTTCPPITLDGAPHPMQPRTAPGAAFPVTVCEATIPKGTKSAAVASTPLHLLNRTPKRVAVVGDTGCRLADPNAFQACDNPAKWPFATIAQQIAAWQPDLIIHVGDYYYREDPCPKGNAGCAGSPTGDTWASWNADFFTPAAPLLSSAPWVFIRGNHEMCDRGGNGWFTFLDPRPMPAKCQTYTEPYAVQAGDVQLLVMDTSAASDGSAPADQVAEYGKELATIKQLAGPNAWFLTHKPVWALVQFGKDRTLATGTKALQTASNFALPGGVQMAFAGHIHLAEVIGFAAEANRAPMFISGNGGTELDDPLTVKIPGTEIGGVPVAGGEAASTFGYLTLEPGANDAWTASARDVNGSTLWTCAVQSKTAGCVP